MCQVLTERTDLLFPGTQICDEKKELMVAGEGGGCPLRR